MRLKLLLSSAILLLISAIPSLGFAQTYFAAFLQTSEEVLTVPASALGYGTFILSADHSRLDYQVVVWSIATVEAAHFHIGARGVEGNIAKEIPMPDTLRHVAVGSWTTTDANVPLTSAIIDSLFAGRVYVNVHTLQNPAGEIRGQLFMPETYFALATGASENPPTTGSGNGAAFFVYNPTDTTVFFRGGASNMSSGLTGAHIHFGPPGSDGPILKSTMLIKSQPDSINGRTTGMWTLTDTTQPIGFDDVNELRNGSLYWNVHTTNNPGGEIRGQIQRGLLSPTDSGMWFMAMMSGPQEGEEPNASNGEGTAFALLSPDRKTLRLQIFYDDLTGPVTDGHIHYGIAGEIPNNGNNIVKHIDQSSTLTWTSSDPDRPLTAADVDSLFMGHYYVNIHTQEFPEGEIRGQLIPLSQPMSLPSAVNSLGQNNALSLGSNYPNPFDASTKIRFTLPVRESVRMLVRNTIGQEIRTLLSTTENAGDHSVEFNAQDLPAGVYYVTLLAGDETRSIAVVRRK